MPQLETRRFRAEVLIRLALYVTGTNELDAARRAERAARDRPGLRDADVVRVTATPLTVAESLSAANARVWQETEALRGGTVNQRQRWAAGCLPEDELLLLVREQLFRPFSLIPRRTRKGPAMIQHRNGMSACEGDGPIPVDWSTLPDPDLLDEQWTALRRVLDGCDQVRRHPWMTVSAPTCVRLLIRQHRGQCQRCEQVASENAVLVEIEWADRVLSREYVL